MPDVTIMLATAFLLVSAVDATADDNLPVWKGHLKDVVGVWNSEGTSSSIIVTDQDNNVFRCALSGASDFNDVIELRDCKPILDIMQLNMQHAANMAKIEEFIRDQIPQDVCGAYIAELYDAFYERFPRDEFTREFGRWDRNPQNSFVREMIEQMDDIFLVDGRAILAEYEVDLERISTLSNGVRVINEGAC